MTNKLSLESLESWLWESANILRGSIDSSDFKNYIFGLLYAAHQVPRRLGGACTGCEAG